MADAVLLDSFRQRLAAHMAGGAQLAPIGFMAFGDGGHDETTLTAKTATRTQTELNHELLRKPITAIQQEDLFSATAKGTVTNSELVGAYLSEAALCDTEGNLIAVRNFAPKVKENDETYDISITLRF